ncbi:nucleotidyl transferase AbiEii/AbiGii toxin family protein [Citricoccus sp. K5]|uniref:nucleotidyl transferase AbiEii/AbiGii toxin family protein n=1 Tax=Citricoccus sp. K5 TaxID=2653135 RepID=UPI00135A2ECE|nr:nucleotidyl transferase AbiEii/AbiGii toxin family protein [Citricoccus sp. K5]
MSEPVPYGSATAVEAAIREAARRASIHNRSTPISAHIRQEHFRRFLSRVFSEGEQSEWLLKGGTGMLARVPAARATKDVDLYRSGFSLNEALVDLRRLASVDLGDHFHFVYAGHTATLGGGDQPYTDGFRVVFDAYVGAQKRSQVKVDLVVGTGLTTQPTLQAPANGLPLPRLVSHDYRLYPVVDQIADKVCATMMMYSGRPSSREKDLIDLVVLAVTQPVNGSELGRAIRFETRRRRLDTIRTFNIPTAWGSSYAAMAKEIPLCSDFRTIDQATKLASAFLDPVLTRPVTSIQWSPQERQWVPAPRTSG